MSEHTKALVVGAVSFACVFALVYFFGKLIFDLVLVLVALGAATAAGVAGYNVVLGRPLTELPWRRRR